MPEVAFVGRSNAGKSSMLNRLTGSKRLVLVMDTRHPLQPFDCQMLDWARSTGTPMFAVLNKCDKLKQGARNLAQRRVAAQVVSISNVEVLTFSARTGLGVEALARRVGEFLGRAED